MITAKLSRTTSQSLAKLHQNIKQGVPIVMELAVNASTYIQPDKYFLLKSSDKIEDILQLARLIEKETLQNCEVAYFHKETDDLLAECSLKKFMDFCDNPLPTKPSRRKGTSH